MTGSHQQNQDLFEFGSMVQRTLMQRLIVLRNIGKITDEDLDYLGELLPTQADVRLLLDNFQPKVDVIRALNELRGMPQSMAGLNRAMIESGDPRATVLRAYRTRIEAAIRYLTADPR